jgi:hypothetical protein
VTASNAKPKGRASPSVSFKEEIAGRETLAAIFEDRAGRGEMSPRNPAATQHYGDRISNAPGATSPKTARAMDGAPDVWVTYGAQTRNLNAQFKAPVAGAFESPDSPEIEVDGTPHGKLDDAAINALPIDQVYSFVVGCVASLLSTEHAQMTLVARRLLRTIPAAVLDDVRRIEVSEGEDSETSLVRVWVTLR